MKLLFIKYLLDTSNTFYKIYFIYASKFIVFNLGNAWYNYNDSLPKVVSYIYSEI